jgi:hypothetical protein
VTWWLSASERIGADTASLIEAALLDVRGRQCGQQPPRSSSPSQSAPACRVLWEFARSGQRSECLKATIGETLANLWQVAPRSGLRRVLCLVELRGLEPLTSCMPLTSQPLAAHHLPMRYLISALLSRRMAST